MGAAETLAEALDALESTLLEIERVANRKDGDRARELIAQRRALSDGMTRVQQAATAAGSPFAQEPVLAEFQREFSKMRSAVALHQATWSVVLIDEAPAAYIASSRNASAATRSFLGWARGVLSSRGIRR